MRSWRFDGAILGVGSTSGVRVVVGLWRASPLGSFADAMVADPDGRRTLVAPRRDVADFIATTYSFDDVVIAPVRARLAAREVTFTGGGLDLRTMLGGRDGLGHLLRALPPTLVVDPRFSRLVSPAARVIAGTRTWGSAGSGRTEAYGARDRRRVLAAAGSWRGVDLGDLAPVDPPVTFGFSSTPAQPGLTSVVTTVRQRAIMEG